MKYKIIIITCTSLLLFGCTDNSKVLTCDNSAESNGVSIDVETKIYYDENGENMHKVVLTTKSTSNDSSIDTYLLAEECDQYKDVPGMACSYKLEKDTAVVAITYDLNKVSDEFLATEGFVVADYDKFKETMELGGFTCK